MHSYYKLLVMLGLLVSFKAANTTIQEELTAFMHKYLQEHRLPGVSIAVVHNQKLVYARGFGYANKELKVPATAHTVYRFGSISKVFTAVAVMQLVEGGQLDLST